MLSGIFPSVAFGCTCAQMDARTYSNTTVKNELKKWLLEKIDISKSKGVTDVFNVYGVPVAMVLKWDGSVIGRIEGFVEPEVFLEQLRGFKN